MFATPKAAYGWLGRLPNEDDWGKHWSTVRAGDRKCKAANKYIRALVLGGNSHLQVQTATRLVTTVMANPDRSRTRWDCLAGSPVATLRNALGKIGFAEVEPWKWEHFTNLRLNLSDLTLRKDKAQHDVRAGWKASMFREFLRSTRHEAQEFREIPDLWGRFGRLDFASVRQWAFGVGAGRTVALLCFVSPAWMASATGVGEACPWCGADAPHFDHLAWSCENRPRTAPMKPNCHFLGRTGWAVKGENAQVINEVRTWLTEVCSTVWRLRHGDPGADRADAGSAA